MPNEIRSEDVEDLLRSKGGHHLSSLGIERVSGALEKSGRTIKKHELRGLLEGIRKENHNISHKDISEIEDVLTSDDGE